MNIIKLTDTTDIKPMYVNVDHVTVIVRDETAKSTMLYFTDGTAEEVVELPEHILMLVAHGTEH